jgi:imidazolonepropionase-like amidohydrolase
MNIMRLLSACLLLIAATSAQDVAVHGDLIHTMAGETISDGIVLVQDGKIAAVGPAASVSVPDGVRVLRAAVVTPGLVDAHTVVGLAGYLNQDTDQDQLDQSDPMQPELRAIDGYNARERLVEWVRGFGVTTIHTGHGPGKLISGQTMIAKTRGNTVDDAVIVPVAMIAATIGETANEESESKSPRTRSKQVAMLRAELVKAREYRDGMSADEDDRPDRDLRLEALARVLDRELPLLMTVQRHNDIATALRLAEEFNLRLILDGAAEAYLVLEEIRAAGVPVIIHPTMMRAWGEMENLALDTAASLAASGIPFALQSGFEDYVPKTRVILYEAGVAAAFGLGSEAALASITIDAARLLGIDDRVGSLEVGKDGDIALYDGDPLEYTTHCVGVLIEGAVVSEETR